MTLSENVVEPDEIDEDPSDEDEDEGPLFDATNFGTWGRRRDTFDDYDCDSAYEDAYDYSENQRY